MIGGESMSSASGFRGTEFAHGLPFPGMRQFPGNTETESPLLRISPPVNEKWVELRLRVDFENSETFFLDSGVCKNIQSRNACKVVNVK